jgi:HD superfamily phosphodiesterase
MKNKFEKIWQLAEPFLNTRENAIHTKIATQFTYKLLEKEGGDRDIAIPAIILHDVGWKRVPEHLQLKAFGPKATMPEVNRVHEVEGVKIARDLLEKVNYDGDKVEEILEIIEGHDSRENPISEIIEGHDSRENPISINDKLVKDADKLWRFSKEAFVINCKRYEQTFEQYLDRVLSKLDNWFITNSAKEIAREEIKHRLEESNSG